MKKNKIGQVSRRDFIRKASTGIAVLAGGAHLGMCSKASTQPNSDSLKKALVGGGNDNGSVVQMSDDLLPRRILGKSGMEVSMLSFGGGSQFMKNRNGKWEPLLERALEMGINLFDTSFSYNGSEERFAEILTPIRQDIFISTKFDGMKDGKRDVDVMMYEFETSLKRLKTDYVDVLMIHAVDDGDSISHIEKTVYKKMDQLKKEGVIKNIGFSSMNSAVKSRDLLKALEFDVCLLAINPTTYGNYEEITIPVAREKNVGIIAMKVMRDVVKKPDVTAKELMHWALDRKSVATAVIGHHGMNILEENAALVEEFKPSLVPEDRWGYLERRMHRYAGAHTLSWAHPNYKDEYRMA